MNRSIFHHGPSFFGEVRRTNGSRQIMKETKFILALLAMAALTEVASAQNTPIPSNAPVVTIAATDPKASELGDTGTFTLYRSGGTNDSLNVFVRIGGTASNGVDYQVISNVVAIPAGASSAQVTVTPIADSLLEGIETVEMAIVPSPFLSISQYLIGLPKSAVVAIADGPVGTNIPPLVRITSPSNGAAFLAPANIAIFAEARDLDGTVATVEFFEGSHSLGVVTNNPLVLSPINPWHVFWTNVGAGIYTLTAKATDDGGASSVSLPVKITVGRPPLQPVVNIVATDPDATEIPVVPPGMERPQLIDPAVFTVTRSGDTGFPLTVYYAIGGTASNGVDYSELSGAVTIPAGADSAMIEVIAIDDFLVEGTETVVIELKPVVCAAMVPPPPDCYLVGHSNRAVAFIHDDDTNINPPPVVTIVATDPDASETGPDPGTFTVTRTGDTNKPLTVRYIIDGTAKNGADYLALSNYVVIPAGSSSADITVTPIDDALVEGTETVLIQLFPPFILVANSNLTTGGVIGSPIPIGWPPPYVVGYPSNAVVKIADNDLSSSNIPPEVKIIAPFEDQHFIAPANIFIQAVARDVDDAVSTVEFFEDGNSLGVKTNTSAPLNLIGPFALVWSNVPPGKYTLTALATDERGATRLSDPVHIFVETNRPPVTNPPIVTIVATDPIASEGTNFWRWPICTAAGDWQTNLFPIKIWGTNPPGVNTA